VWPGGGGYARLAGGVVAGDAFRLAVLAYGMGGHAGGATASALACEAFVEAYAAGAGATAERLRLALETANEAIARKVRERPMYSGMGSTLVGAHFSDAGVSWVSVGDSPLYLYRDGVVTLLNEDHSMAPEIDRLAEAGRISWEMARNDPRRHYLRSAVTGSEMEMIDLAPGPVGLVSGDVVIVASDGIHTLEMARIAAEIRAAEGGSEFQAEVLAQRLIAAVEDAREAYQDNTTVVVVRVV
jgi:protein phosphatase